MPDERSLKLEVTLTKVEHDLLQRLAASGLYGLTPAHAAERLIAEGLVRRIPEEDLRLRLKEKP